MNTSHPAHADLIRRLTPPELPVDRGPLPQEIRDRMPLNALRAVAETHTPCILGDWVLCSDCSVIVWRRITDQHREDPTTMPSKIVYPCDTIRAITEDDGYGLVIDWHTANAEFLAANADVPAGVTA